MGTVKKSYGYIDADSYYRQLENGFASREWDKLMLLFAIPKQEQIHVDVNHVDGEVYAMLPVEELCPPKPKGTVTPAATVRAHYAGVGEWRFIWGDGDTSE